MNPIYQKLMGNQNPFLNFIQQFNQFRSTFNGNAEAQIKSMLQSGQLTQEQYNIAMQKAQQIMQFLPK